MPRALWGTRADSKQAIVVHAVLDARSGQPEGCYRTLPSGLLIVTLVLRPLSGTDLPELPDRSWR